MESDQLVECSWCGGECWEGEYRNRRGEVFCTKWHRRQSNEALKDLLQSNPGPQAEWSHGVSS